MLCRAALACWAGLGDNARAWSAAACSREGVNLSSVGLGVGVNLCMFVCMRERERVDIILRN